MRTYLLIPGFILFSVAVKFSRAAAADEAIFKR